MGHSSASPFPLWDLPDAAVQTVVECLAPVWRSQLRLVCRRACAAVNGAVLKVPAKVNWHSLTLLPRLARDFRCATELQLTVQRPLGAFPRVAPQLAEVLAKLPPGAWGAMQRATVDGDLMSMEMVAALMRAFPKLRHMSRAAVRPGCGLATLAPLWRAAATLTSLDLCIVQHGLSYTSSASGFAGLAAGLLRLPRLSRLSIDLTSASPPEGSELAAVAGALSGLRSLQLLGAGDGVAGHMRDAAAAGAVATALTSLALGRAGRVADHEGFVTHT